MIRLIYSVLLSLCLLCDAWSMSGPQQQVENVVTSVLAVLEDQRLSAEEKYAQISDRVQEFLDVPVMAQYTLGPHWDGATLEERQRFTDLFVRILEGTYLNKVNDYSGGEVVYLEERIKGEKALVNTKFINKDQEIQIQYNMILNHGKWQVFDVIIEGVSLIRNYRSSYGEIIRRNGYDGVFHLMEKKIKETKN